ncbi:MAG: bifunctional 5,10-methylenetetrahydrofolate dehydrogenase/5,10-methenyltetrahydrofolate cyclohydrolase [Patescibacteria group bacterium]
MLLSPDQAIDELTEEILLTQTKLGAPPLLALVWVGNDKQTEKFVRAKQKKALELGIEFQLHHFDKAAERQLEALISSLNENKKVDGIIVQLPLPPTVNTDRVLSHIEPSKDVDGLVANNFPSPTPTGVVMLLERNGLDLKKSQTVILGAGRLVGKPLAEIFKRNDWPFSQIASQAEKHIEKIRTHDILIAATGVEKLVGGDFVTEKMTVVDASGVDVDFEPVAKKAKMISPQRGAIGPLTILLLLKNVATAAELRQDSSKRTRPV